MIVHGDRELLETRRSYRSLTDRIHRQWEPDKHDLNQGTFQRGKKPPGVPTIDSWLSFTGSHTDQANGVVDAFAGQLMVLGKEGSICCDVSNFSCLCI